MSPFLYTMSNQQEQEAPAPPKTISEIDQLKQTLIDNQRKHQTQFRILY